MLFKSQLLRVYLSFITYFGIRNLDDILLPSSIISKVAQNDNSSHNKDGLSNLASRPVYWAGTRVKPHSMPCQAVSPSLENVPGKEGRSIVKCKARWLLSEDLSLCHLQERIFGELVIAPGEKKVKSGRTHPN